ncbi:MAG: hypothetical protein HY238_14100, partial [Acidobacteria bacterium]|nr:hypothetical protein [Acidobacteriota bacterium]
MQRRFVLWSLAAAAVVGIWISAQPQRVVTPTRQAAGAGAVSFRILMGLGDPEPSRWDGSIRLTGGTVRAIEIWRPEPDDRVENQTWKLSTHRLPLPAAQARLGRQAPMVENGVLVETDLFDAAAKFEVQTTPGNFTFTANQVELGEPRNFLDGRVSVERVPATTQITNSIEEQDYPAAAQSGDTVYIAYVEFTHGDRAQKWPQQMAEKPKSFEPLARPAGGDQVRLIEYSKSRKTWSTPYAASGVRQDVYRTAVAVDGEDRVWVIWSAQAHGNFDLYARWRKNGNWSDEIKITQDPGPDLNPVAATDSTGAVWVAWQGWRKDNFDILVARQRGAGFSKEERVSTSLASDWDPQIAAGKNGEVAVVWDTYDKGDYDVYLRRLHYAGKIGMDAPLPIAATQKFEARASVAYDRDNRIWVAYEEQPPAWGKDFGAYETTGAGLYQGSTVRVKVVNGSQYFTTADKLEETVETTPAAQPKVSAGAAVPKRRPFAVKKAQQLARTPAELPDPELAKNRPPNATPYAFAVQARSFPRLASDGQIIFLAYRANAPTTRGPLGSTWFEHVAYFDGRDWSGPVFLPQSDNLLDNRPALLSTGPGDLLVVASTDHRFSLTQQGPRAGRTMEMFNNDLVVAELNTRARGRLPELVPIGAEKPEDPSPEVAAEKEQVAMMRNYRLPLGNEKLQLLRGEFHRHTELSGDGGRDGPLIDAYRYMIDA